MIELERVSFTYKGSNTRSVNDISLSISAGECVLVCGPSGCGKTTFLRLINGLVPHFYRGNYEGTVIAAGMNSKDTPLYRLSAKIGTVYQNPRAQFFNIDTNSEVAFGIENMAYPREELLRRVEKAVHDANIVPLMNRSIFELSGGEKQKIAFASVYAMEPHIYLLDEPSSNLDEASTRELRKRLQSLKNCGKTILICEHRLHFLNGLVDRVIYMNDGAITGTYTADSFFSIEESDRIGMGLRSFDLSNTAIRERTPAETPLLRLDSVAAGYNKRAVVRNISFEAAAGEVIGLFGHNGAGKTTLAETICGLNKTLEGNIEWKGRPFSSKQRQKISYMVFQDVDYQLFADSVENECGYGLERVETAAVDRSLELLALEEYRDLHPATLSGGQKQRLAVAVSMICGKQIIVFDEPTSGLDLRSMERVTSIVRSLADAGKLVFVVTHDLEFIAAACGRILNIHDGALT